MYQFIETFLMIMFNYSKIIRFFLNFGWFYLQLYVHEYTALSHIKQLREQNICKRQCESVKCEKQNYYFLFLFYFNKIPERNQIQSYSYKH